MQGERCCHSENVIYAAQMKRNYHAMILAKERVALGEKAPRFLTNNTARVALRNLFPVCGRSPSLGRVPSVARSRRVLKYAKRTLTFMALSGVLSRFTGGRSKLKILPCYASSILANFCLHG